MMYLVYAVYVKALYNLMANATGKYVFECVHRTISKPSQS